MKYTPYDYQKYITRRIIESKRLLVSVDMGLGKTSSTLAAIVKLMYEQFSVNKVLVISKKAISKLTWKEEVEKWDEFRDLRISCAVGNPNKRKQALERNADIYTINVENVRWLLDFYKERQTWPYDMLVIDESSMFKNRKTKKTSYYHCVEVFSKITPRIVLLTGTPSPNGYQDIFGQIYLLDHGERLSSSKEKFLTTYFAPKKIIDHNVVSWRMKNGAKEIIERKIRDISFSLSASEYIKLPGRVDNIVKIELDKKSQELYDQFEHDYLVELDENTLVASSAAVVTGKLLQMANGAVYKNESTDYVEIHDMKLQALKEIVDDTGESVLVFYSYQHDVNRFKTYFKDYDFEVFDGSEEQKKRWDSGEIKILFAHPAQAGHGLNLQQGGHIIVWFGLTWNLEHYLQANARLYRQGQKYVTVVHHLLVKGSVDEDVYKSLQKKEELQQDLIKAIRARIKEAKSHD